MAGKAVRGNPTAFAGREALQNADFASAPQAPLAAPSII
jgi:hypothetical protein